MEPTHDTTCPTNPEEHEFADGDLFFDEDYDANSPEPWSLSLLFLGMFAMLAISAWLLSSGSKSA